MKKYEFINFSEAEKDSSAHIKQESYEGEGFKGCSPKISKVPVGLEPAFKSYRVMDFAKDVVTPKEVQMNKPEGKSVKWRYLRVWLAAKDDSKSRDAFTSLLTKLGSLGQKFSITLGGNKNKAMIIIGIDKDSVGPAKNAVTSIYSLSEIDVSDINPLFQNVSDNNCVGMLEFYTSPPYWSTLFVPEENIASMILPVLSADFATGEMGFFEIIIQPCKHDWGSNILNLSSAESSGGVPQRVLREWRMAGFGTDYSDKTKDKLNQPMYAATIRIAAFCKEEKMDAALKSLSLSVSGCLWRGQRLKVLTEHDYIQALGIEKTLDMIRNSTIYREGSLLSIEELSRLSPLPEKEDLCNERFRLDKATGIYLSEESSQDGVFIGNMRVAGKEQKLFLEEKYFRRGVSIVGDMGSGKTTLIAQMILHDIERSRKFRKESLK